MYVVHDTLLGEAPASPPAAPSIWDSFMNLANSGVQAGFNIYNKVQNIKQTQQQASQAQAQAQALMRAYSGNQQTGLTQPMTGVQPGMISQSGGSSFGWILPVALGVGALTLIIALRK